MTTEAKSFRKLVNIANIFQSFLTDHYALTHYAQSPEETRRKKIYYPRYQYKRGCQNE